MEQWATEVKTKTRPGQLKVTTHHGPSRAKSESNMSPLIIDGKKLENYDVVITTYQTLASEHAQDADSDSDKPGGALFQLKWLRIVLGMSYPERANVDEAHNIKNRNTKAAKAAVALRAKYRWCLTG
jgi:SNF2 family DNA or RNA helicase